MHSEPQIALSITNETRAQQWNVVAAVLVCVALPLVVFASSVLDMAAIWRRSETFAHGFLVMPAFIYLVWQQRAELASFPVRPAPLALLGVLGAGLVWTLGTLAAAPAPGFFALVGMVSLSVIAVLGWRFARAIWVPLAFLIFAVPFGEAFIPKLMEWTADFVVEALRATGVPVFREGQNFVIPSGRWSVVEACSGIRYLLASVFVGSLFARLMFRSFARRLAFIAASVAVPIIANWLRAYMIVMLGHLSGNRIAVGVDHLLYGWVFFGLVMLLLFWLGGLWREDQRPVPANAQAQGSEVTLRSQAAFWRNLAPMLVAILTIAVGWKVATVALIRTGDTRPVQMVAVEGSSGWRSMGGEDSAWQPRLQAPSALLAQRFEKGGQRLTMVIGVYRNQSESAKLVTSIHYLSRLIHNPWQLTSDTRQSIQLGTSIAEVNTAKARRGEDTLVVWQWHWVRGRITINDPWAKVALAFDRLLAHSDTSAWIAVFSVDDHNGVAAQAALKAFAAEMGPSIDRALAETAAR